MYTFFGISGTEKGRMALLHTSTQIHYKYKKVIKHLLYHCWSWEDQVDGGQAVKEVLEMQCLVHGICVINIFRWIIKMIHSFQACKHGQDILSKSCKNKDIEA